MTDSIETKLGTTRAGERTRIWLQGQRLPEHGFPMGAKFSKTWSRNKLVIERILNAEFEDLTRASRGTVSGDIARPVIDITGALVSQTFKSDTVIATFSKGRIVITG